MTHLIFLIVSIALLAGFVALTRYETTQGMRFFAPARDRLDEKVRHLEYIWEHVDLAAFMRDEIRLVANRSGHAIAHLSLQVVRAVERLLTRIVRSLRTRHEDAVMPRENAREFVKTLSDFKGGLNAKHPEISDIQEEEKQIH